MNVRANIAFPLKCQGIPPAEPRAASRRRRPRCASGTSSTGRSPGLASGDRQRVALGRAIVREPKAFLMDEPLGTLDAEMRELMCVELRRCTTGWARRRCSSRTTRTRPWRWPTRSS
jgi:multiple sugar transport system ATP-binding protein